MKRSCNLLLLTGIIVGLLSFFIRRDSTVDLHVHDTYFIIAKRHVAWALSVSALFIWILCRLTGKCLLSKRLSWMHITTTVITLSFIALILLADTNHYHDLSGWNSSGNNREWSKLLAAALLLFIIAQFLFIVNLVSGISKKISQSFRR